MPRARTVAIPAEQAEAAVKPKKYIALVVDNNSVEYTVEVYDAEQAAKSAAADQAQTYIDNNDSSPRDLQVFVFPSTYEYNIIPRRIELEKK